MGDFFTHSNYSTKTIAKCFCSSYWRFAPLKKIYKTLTSSSLFNRKCPVQWCWSCSQTCNSAHCVSMHVADGPSGPLSFIMLFSFLAQSTPVTLTVRPDFSSKSWMKLFECSQRWQTFQQRKTQKGWRKYIPPDKNWKGKDWKNNRSMTLK